MRSQSVHSRPPDALCLEQNNKSGPISHDCIELPYSRTFNGYLNYSLVTIDLQTIAMDWVK